MKYTTYGLLVLLTFQGCLKDQPVPSSTFPVLPPITQTGANTFGCRVNGVNYVPYEAPFYQTSLGPSAYGEIKSKGIIYLYVRFQDATHNQDIGVSFGPIKKLSLKYTFGKDSLANAYFNDYKIQGHDYSFVTDLLHSGMLLLSRFDTVQKIVSGTFSFTGVRGNGQKVEITDGRFDVQYK